MSKLEEIIVVVYYMANKTVLKKEENLNSREAVNSHPVMRAVIYSFTFPNQQNSKN